MSHHHVMTFISADFGLSKQFSDASFMKSNVGTLVCMDDGAESVFSFGPSFGV